MTDAEIEAALEKATPGPYHAQGDRIFTAEGAEHYDSATDPDLLVAAVWSDASEDDAKLLAMAPALARLALDRGKEIERLRAALNGLVDACHRGRLVTKPGCGIGGQTIDANLRASNYNGVDAWAVEVALAALNGGNDAE